MATVKISCADYQHTFPTSDAGAAMLVEHIAKTFSEHGGAWIGGDTGDVDNPATAVLDWYPAAGTTVRAWFEEGSIPPNLIDLPSFLK